MRKIGLYARIITIVLFLCSCTKTENELIQDSTETVEGIQDPAGMEEDIEIVRAEEWDDEFTISGSDIPDMMNKTKIIQSFWDMESASVSDSDVTITLGTLFEDFIYDETEIPSEIVVNNYVGSVNIHGVYHDWYFHNYTDFYINTSDYNLVTHDMSGRNIYILQINLTTSRFCTSRGITIGAALEEIETAYADVELVEVRENEPYWINYIYDDGYVRTGFYLDTEDKQVIKISLSLGYRYRG